MITEILSSGTGTRNGIVSYHEKLTANQSKQMEIMGEIIQRQGLNWLFLDR